MPSIKTRLALAIAAPAVTGGAGAPAEAIRTKN